MDVKTSDWRPGPTVCRCCLTEGCYKDISTEYFWMGKREVYAEMLSETLNVSIAYSQSTGPNSNSRLICEPCISRLRDATDFRRQVLECEKTFMQHLDPGSSSVQKELRLTHEDVKLEKVKQEKRQSDDEDFDDRVDFVVDNDDDDDDLDDEPLMKLASKVPKKEVDLMKLLDSSQITVKRKATTKSKEPPTKKTKKQIILKPSASKAAKPSVSSLKVVEKKKKELTPNVIARTNATLLVQYTTAFPFKLPSDDIACVVCCKEFRAPEDFRRHMKEDGHKNPQKMFRYMPKNYSIKIDITELRCRVCSQAFENVDEIANHLSTVHCIVGINLTQDMGVHPFKIRTGNYTCVFCSEKLVTLRALSRHTQSHYLNYTCETCGKSYGNTNALKVHNTFAHAEKTLCRHCKKAFESAKEKREHMMVSRKCWLYTCNACGERFMSRNLRVKHSQSVHNTDNQHPCPECPEIFPDKAKRRKHFITTHTEKFKCTCCNKSFASNFSLNNHLVVHSSEKSFKCEVCLKDFSRLKSLKQHMPIHMENKPYQCTMCNKQFNQRVSLRTHLSTYHPEVSELKTIKL